MKKSLSIIALVLSLTLALAACGGAGGASQSAAAAETGAASTAAAQPVETRAVTLRFEDFNANGDNEHVLRDQIEAFNKIYPDITIDLQTVAYDGYTSQLMAKISAGGAPDIYELSFADFVSFAAKDVLAPMDGLLADQGLDTSVYNTAVIESFRYGDTLYGLPSNFSNVVMFYNQDLFDQAGLDYPTSDWTWTDAEEAGKAIRALDENIYGYFRPVTYNEFYKVTAQNGGSIMNEDGTAFTVNTPEAIGAAEYMVSLINDSNIQATDEQMAGMGGWDLFQSGRLGMLMTGIWGIPTFTENCEFNWDIEMEPAGVQHATHFFTNAFVINKDCEYPEEAALFIHFLTSNEAATNLAVDANWVVPAVNDQALIDRYTAITPPNNKAAVFESVDYLVMAPVIEQSSEAADIVNSWLGKIVSGMDAGEALEACQKELDEKINLS